MQIRARRIYHFLRHVSTAFQRNQRISENRTTALLRSLRAFLQVLGPGAEGNLLPIELAYYLEKLRTTPDGGGTLLDNMLLIYGSGMSDSNQHSPANLPILLAGGASGRLKGGRHLKAGADVPLANLHLTLLDRLDVPIETIGNSTGRLNAVTL